MPVNNPEPLYWEIGVKKWEQVSPVCLGFKIKCWSESRWKRRCEMLPSSPVDLLSVLDLFSSLSVPQFRHL